MDDETMRAIRRHTGAGEYNTFIAQFSPDDVEDLWNESGNVRLVAAEILTSLAGTGGESLRKLGDVTVDTKGQGAAYLSRAAVLRRAAFGLPGATVAPWGVVCPPDREW